MGIIDTLLSLRDEEYAKFIANLTPTISKEKFIGVRVPMLRKMAKELKNNQEAKDFLDCLPHSYYEENLLHSILISYINDYDECLKRVNEFLPYIDNWAVSDTLKTKVLMKKKEDYLININKWINSNYTYSIRVGIDALQTYFLDEYYKKEYLDLVSKIRSNEYYVNMMISWYFATALAKQYDDAIKIIENKKLDKWCHNKTIQKAIESYRISDEKKEYLRGLKY